MNHNDFEIIMLNYSFEDYKSQIKKLMSDDKSFVYIIEELKYELTNVEKIIPSKNIKSYELCRFYLNELSTKSVKELYKDRITYLKLYLSLKYRINCNNFWFEKCGYSLSTEEIESLKKIDKLNYIMAHRILEDYSYFLYLDKREMENTLVFEGESMINSLPNKIDHIDELFDFQNYLVKNDHQPFLIFINKDLYYSLRKVEKGLKFEPSRKKQP